MYHSDYYYTKARQALEMCLNPYSTGCTTLTIAHMIYSVPLTSCLNPYSTGCTTLTYRSNMDTVNNI